MIVPWQGLSKEALQGLLEEYVSRDGTDYGERETSLCERVQEVRGQLAAGHAAIWFDEATETVSIFSREEMRARGLS